MTSLTHSITISNGTEIKVTVTVNSLDDLDLYNPYVKKADAHLAKTRFKGKVVSATLSFDHTTPKGSEEDLMFGVLIVTLERGPDGVHPFKPDSYFYDLTTDPDKVSNKLRSPVEVMRHRQVVPATPNWANDNGARVKYVEKDSSAFGAAVANHAAAVGAPKVTPLKKHKESKKEGVVEEENSKKKHKVDNSSDADFSKSEDSVSDDK